MKKWILMLILLSGSAQALELSFKHLSDTSGDENFHMQSWRGIEVKSQSQGLYYFASYETATVVMVYPAFEINFIGLGFGFKKPVTKDINFYGQLGYYIVDTSLKGRFACANHSCGEGLYYGLNNRWADLHYVGKVWFNEYEITTTNGYGITLGAELLHPLSKNTNLIFGVEWRALSFNTMVAGMSPVFGDYDVNGQRWESYFKGIDSINFKIGIEYKF